MIESTSLWTWIYIVFSHYIFLHLTEQPPSPSSSFFCPVPHPLLVLLEQKMNRAPFVHWRQQQQQQQCQPHRGRCPASVAPGEGTPCIFGSQASRWTAISWRQQGLWRSQVSNNLGKKKKKKERFKYEYFRTTAYSERLQNLLWEEKRIQN